MRNNSHIDLLKNWKIQSSKEINEDGAKISTDSSLSNNWIPAEVPSTVLGTLTINNIIKDPFYGENLKNISKKPYQVPWWWITEFELDGIQANKHALLSFDGINNKANVWLNGKQIATENDIDGAFRVTSFDVSKNTRSGKNILAVEVVPPKPGDFTIGYVDWNPAPPDGNMGIFRPVHLKLTEGISIERPFVQSRVNLKTLKEAELTVSAELVNYTNKTITGILTGTIESVKFEKTVTIPANTKLTETFEPEDFKQLHFLNPRIWWPVHMGKPELYDLNLQFSIDERTSDTTTTRFGIREVEDYWLQKKHRGFKVNGKKVLIKGGGWVDDLFLMDSDKSVEAQIDYVKQMNLNCIRLEGFWGKSQKLYDLCDENGILIMVGWSCHWEWELHLGVPVNERYGGVYKPKDIEHVSQMWEDQVIWLRNHPSLFVWTIASDKVPIVDLEKKYIETFKKYDPTRPYLNSTGGVGSEQGIIGDEEVISDISGSSGVKMLGPYAYTAPGYWYTDKKLGGAYGFNTETGPGAQVPQLDSLVKFIPKDKLWPISEVWDFHCGRYEFSDLSRFRKAITERYGSLLSLEDFDKKAQAMNYELMRPMFEAFRVNKEIATGVIQWMLNAAWPKMYWQLYDYYLNPNGAFFGTQTACSPLSLIYNYGDKQIYLVNDHLHKVKNLQSRIRVYNVNSILISDKRMKLNAEKDSSVSVFEIKVPDNISGTYFVDLRLYDSAEKEIHHNFYWLSTKEEILDYEADLGDFAFHTPSKEYSDFTLLNNMPKVSLTVSSKHEIKDNEQKITVSLENNSDLIAFLINLKLVEKDSGKLILPVFWEDNLISLTGKEKKTVRVTCASDVKAEVKVEGWNLI